jgi:hypothetical protein
LSTGAAVGCTEGSDIPDIIDDAAESRCVVV